MKLISAIGWGVTGFVALATATVFMDHRTDAEKEADAIEALAGLDQTKAPTPSDIDLACNGSYMAPSRIDCDVAQDVVPGRVDLTDTRDDEYKITIHCSESDSSIFFEGDRYQRSGITITHQRSPSEQFTYTVSYDEGDGDGKTRVATPNTELTREGDQTDRFLPASYRAAYQAGISYCYFNG